jgi:DNA recombination protein RmuC
MVIAILCALLVGGLVAFAVLRFLPAHLRRHLAGEREATVQAAVETVVRIAGDRLDQHAKSGTAELDLRTQDISRQLSQVTDLVATLQKDRANQHGEMLSGLDAARQASSELAGLTGQLRQALASPKTRGAWGERMAEDVLRRAGLAEGLNYRKQTAVAGGPTIPDFTFLLPRGHVVHMDVKFPIDNYLRHLDADSDVERDRTAKQFTRDVRARVKELTGRGYADPEHTVEFLLLFIPNESVYSFIHEQDPELVDHAMAQKVVLCSPFSLFSMLAIIRKAMDNFLVEETSAEIIKCLGGLDDQWSRLSEAIEKVGRGLKTTQGAYDDLEGTRRRAFEKKLTEIQELRTERPLPAAVGHPDEVGPVVDLPGITDLSGRRAG